MRKSLLSLTLIALAGCSSGNDAVNTTPGDLSEAVAMSSYMKMSGEGLDSARTGGAEIFFPKEEASITSSGFSGSETIAVTMGGTTTEIAIVGEDAPLEELASRWTAEALDLGAKYQRGQVTWGGGAKNAYVVARESGDGAKVALALTCRGSSRLLYVSAVNEVSMPDLAIMKSVRCLDGDDVR